MDQTRRCAKRTTKTQGEKKTNIYKQQAKRLRPVLDVDMFGSIALTSADISIRSQSTSRDGNQWIRYCRWSPKVGRPYRQQQPQGPIAEHRTIGLTWKPLIIWGVWYASCTNAAMISKYDSFWSLTVSTISIIIIINMCVHRYDLAFFCAVYPCVCNVLKLLT